MWYFFAWIGFCLIVVFILFATATLKSSDTNLEKVEQGQMSKVFYQGHTYVVWSINFGGGISHDPDCKCFNNGKNNE